MEDEEKEKGQAPGSGFGGGGWWRVGSDMGALSLAQDEMDEVLSIPPPRSRPGK